jgi:hypothetical protein
MTDERSPEDAADEQPRVVSSPSPEPLDANDGAEDDSDLASRIAAITGRAFRQPDRRLLVGGVVAILGLGTVLASRSVEPALASPFGAGATPPLPAASPAGTSTASWVCPVVQTTEDQTASSAIHIANIGATPVRGSVRFLAADDSAPAPIEVDLAPTSDGRILLPPSPSPVAAVVELLGGVGIVEQTITSVLGTTTSPCASAASRSWYFADGSTLRGTSYQLVIANPFATDATLDINLSDGSTIAQRQDLQGYVVPAGTVGVVDISSELQREAIVSVSVEARRGRVVAGRWQRSEGLDGARRGQVAGLGAPTLSTSWWFASGTQEPGVSQRIVIANPSDERAEVELTVYPTSADAVPVAVPVDSVAPGEVRVVDISTSQLVPAGLHQIIVRSPNNVALVVERAVDVTGERPLATNQFGSPRLATAWWFVAGDSQNGSQVTLTVSNPTGAPATVQVRRQGPSGLQDVPGYGSFLLEAGTLVEVPIVEGAVPTTAANLVVFVTADSPIVVERRWARGERGTSRSLGIPTRDSIASLPEPVDPDAVSTGLIGDDAGVTETSAP